VFAWELCGRGGSESIHRPRRSAPRRGTDGVRSLDLSDMGERIYGRRSRSAALTSHRHPSRASGRGAVRGLPLASRAGSPALVVRRPEHLLREVVDGAVGDSNAARNGVAENAPATAGDQRIRRSTRVIEIDAVPRDGGAPAGAPVAFDRALLG
jgi:hypothetical protein